MTSAVLCETDVYHNQVNFSGTGASESSGISGFMQRTLFLCLVVLMILMLERWDVWDVYPFLWLLVPAVEHPLGTLVISSEWAHLLWSISWRPRLPTKYGNDS